MNALITSAAMLVTTIMAVQPAAAATVTPVSGSTSDLVTSGSIENTIDGVIDFNSGIVFGPIALGTFGGPYTIAYQLGGNFDLTAMNLWNNLGNAGSDGEGIDSFTLRFHNSASQLLGVFSGRAADTLPKQSFALNQTNVSLVELQINSNHAPTVRQYVAFYEINFDGSPTSPVPEPTTSALLLAGIAAAFGIRRKRSSSMKAL